MGHAVSVARRLGRQLAEGMGELAALLSDMRADARAVLAELRADIREVTR